MQNFDRNSNLVVLATLEAKNGKRKELLDILVSLVEPARKEEGNISYTLCASTDNPNEFLLYEDWINKEYFDKHYESPKSYRDREAVSGLLVRPLQIKTYVSVNNKLE
jgi:quinol monooxygenase YgiN